LRRDVATAGEDPIAEEQEEEDEAALFF